MTDAIKPADDKSVSKSIEELGESYATLLGRWANRPTEDRSATIEAAQAVLTDAAWVLFELAPEHGLGADRMLLRDVVRAYDSTYGDAHLDPVVDRIRAHLGKGGS